MGVLPPEMQQQAQPAVRPMDEDLDERPEWARQLVGFQLGSEAFTDGQAIPRRYTCAGEDLSPPLAWGSPPPGTRSLALILEDPDAPRGVFTHWMVVNLRPEPGDLVEGRGSDPSDVVGAHALTNDFGQVGWGGPCPPQGSAAHRYRFRMLALDFIPQLPPSTRRADFDRVVQGHVLEETTLTGLFGR